MSTEADIVVELEQQARNRTVNLGASDAWKYSVEYRAIQEITKLRADRDAAARDMQERCAKTLEVRGRNDLAETIRALPVIATEGGTDA